MSKQWFTSKSNMFDEPNTTVSYKKYLIFNKNEQMQLLQHTYLNSNTLETNIYIILNIYSSYITIQYVINNL